MTKATKEQRLNIRVSEHEKKEIEAHAKKRGFDTVTAYVLWLFRQDKEAR